MARTGDFKDLAHNLAMQVAAMSPSYVDESDVPDGHEDDDVQDCLMQQAYIRDPSMTVQDLVKEAVENSVRTCASAGLLDSLLGNDHR